MKAETPRLIFESRKDFREWLKNNAKSQEGVWLVFGKTASVKTLSAGDALEEALCFGWIDGVIKSEDGGTYLKYFKKRAKDSVWSERNKAIVQKLESEGLMTDLGMEAVKSAKQSGEWDAKKRNKASEEEVRDFESLIMPHDAAWENYQKMPRSYRLTYAASYVFTKTAEGKQKRLSAVIKRLELNLNPMESMKT